MTILIGAGSMIHGLGKGANLCGSMRKKQRILVVHNLRQYSKVTFVHIDIKYAKCK